MVSDLLLATLTGLTTDRILNQVAAPSQGLSCLTPSAAQCTRSRAWHDSTCHSSRLYHVVNLKTKAAKHLSPLFLRHLPSLEKPKVAHRLHRTLPTGRNYNHLALEHNSRGTSTCTFPSTLSFSLHSVILLALHIYSSVYISGANCPCRSGR